MFTDGHGASLPDPEDDPPFDPGVFRLVNQFSEQVLLDMFHGDDFAFATREFCPPFICEHIARRVLDHANVSPYKVEPMFWRLGETFYDGNFERYFANARRDMQELRDLCKPYGSPLDGLHCILDELWPWGATIATINGQRMKAKIARVVPPGGSAKVHVDSRGFDAKRFQGVPPLKKQFSFIVALRMPRRGGELAVWDTRIVTEEDEAALRLPDHAYALDEQKLGRPHIFRPRQGDLYWFDTNHPHAVLKSDDWRVNMAVFVGYASDGKPLYLWS